MGGPAQCYQTILQDGGIRHFEFFGQNLTTLATDRGTFHKILQKHQQPLSKNDRMTKIDTGRNSRQRQMQ